MLLTTGVFLFRFLCAMVPCDPVFQSPEILSTPKTRTEYTRNLNVRSIEPIVKTRAGIVEGYHTKSSNGRTFFAFEGIPYGESTAGPRRWKPPVPKRPWNGVRSAKSHGASCLQMDSFRILKVHGSEDCLFLNVFTPNFINPTSMDDKSFRKYPVVVFIHGGAFFLGGGKEYGPTYIMDENIVLVSLNYRLGPLGFLSTGDKVISGNYGLHDQGLALKWVHENIEFFGGNAKNVTLMGNSAGSVSAHLHLIANKTREYFSTAYCSSGTAFQHWAVRNSEQSRSMTNRLAETFGCSTENSQVLARCLRRIDPHFLVSAQFNLYNWAPFPVVLFSPTVEPEHPDAFLTVWPDEAYKAGTVAKKPAIMGLTKSEGKSMMSALLLLGKTIPLRLMWDQVAPYYLEYKDIVDQPERITEQINKFFLRGESPGQTSLDVFADASTVFTLIENMLSDRYINFGVVKGIQAHANAGVPTYFYHFSFSEGNHNFGNMVGYKSSEWGAGHIEDILYFFNISLIADAHQHSDPDRQLSQIMIKLLVSFAETGIPTYRTETGKVYEIWKPVRNSSDIKGIQFDKIVEMVDLPKAKVERVKFWDSLHLPNITLLSPL